MTISFLNSDTGGGGTQIPDASYSTKGKVQIGGNGTGGLKISSGVLEYNPEQEVTNSQVLSPSSNAVKSYVESKTLFAHYGITSWDVIKAAILRFDRVIAHHTQPFQHTIFHLSHYSTDGAYFVTSWNNKTYTLSVSSSGWVYTEQ